MADLEYLSLSKPRRILYRFLHWFINFGRNFINFFKSLPHKLRNGFSKIGNPFVNLIDAFKYGGWKTRVSFLIFGFGNLCNGQFLRGILFLVYEIVFIYFMITFGGVYLSKFNTLGTIPTYENPDTGFKPARSGRRSQPRERCSTPCAWQSRQDRSHKRRTAPAGARRR